jgi:hypothetical protein
MIKMDSNKILFSQANYALPKGRDKSSVEDFPITLIKATESFYSFSCFFLDK